MQKRAKRVRIQRLKHVGIAHKVYKLDAGCTVNKFDFWPPQFSNTIDIDIDVDNIDLTTILDSLYFRC